MAMDNIIEENLENDQNLINKSSEKVANTGDTALDNLTESDSDEIVVQKKVKRNLLDSDDETTIPMKQTVEGNESNDYTIERNIPTKTTHKRFTIIDSDSEDVNYPTPHNKSFEEKSNREAPIYSLNEKGKTVIESVVDEHMKRLSVLCDSDSSPDEQDNIQEFASSGSRKHTQMQKSNHKSAIRQPKEEKPISMSTKDALIQRKEIRSESQRMTREMNVSLPYHKPKTRTLQEFLQKRPRFAAAIPSKTLNTLPSVALKMSKKDLEIVSQNMSEREKQLEEFFKSESESEDETLSAADIAEKMTTEENDTKDVQKEISNGTFNKEKSDLIEPENENLNKDNTAVTEEKNVLDYNADNRENKSYSHVGNTKSIVVLQNVLLNQNDENFDSGILDDFANKTVLTGLDSNDGATGQLSLEKTELDLLMDKYDVGKSDILNKDEELNMSKTPKINVLELVKEKLGDVQPRLSGTGDDFINFDENVNKLQQRFVKHTTKKQHHKHNVQVDIVSFTNGEIRTEKLAVSVDDDEIPILEKPGERLKQLKTELEMQMAKRRSKFWEQRLNSEETDKVNDSKKGKDSGNSDDDKDNMLDIEDEDEFTEIEDDEDEDILDENADIDEEEDRVKLKAKCAFGDTEAVESDDHGENMDVDDDGYMQNEIVEEEESSVDADDEDEPLRGDIKKKKKLKRILKALENDSDDDQPSTPLFENKIVNRTKSTDLLFDTTDTLEDLSGPTPHQRQDQRTPTKRTTTLTRSDLGFLTPVIQLTGLQSLNSGSKFLHDSPVSPFRMPQSSPHMSQNGPQKKLFADTQALDEDIEDVCSGKFTTQTEPEHNTNKFMSSNTNRESAPSLEIEETCEEERPQTTNTQEFLEVCSGKFTGITQLKSSSKMNKNFEANEEGSSRNNYYFAYSTTQKEIKSFDDENDGKLISQLLDEAEMERFKKKFDSPEKLSSQNDEDDIVKVGRVIFDSSDEEEYEADDKRKRKNFIIDDDDDDKDNKVLMDAEDEAEEFEDITTNVVEYDSEENEIEIREGAVAPKRLKASDFFENEAELSESEWGSADEDEKGLDILELEDGDTEKLDEDQVKRDLERIHMRRVLDDDNYEVKMLQEMLLADGELHGSGRERQFRWKTMNSMGNEDTVPRDDDGEVYPDDENEDEEKWRKMRHERESFLKKQQEKSQNMEDDSSNIDTKSQIFKLGQAAIKRSFSNTPNITIIEKRPVAESPEIKTSFTLMSKKGSFLTRSEHVLQKVAEFTSKTANLTIGGPKNTKNFVFQSVTTEANEIVNKDLKRKAMDGTPVAIKKLRLDTISPCVQKKNQKPERAKKLFSNW